MRTVRFLEFELDLDLYSLSKNGEAVSIGPRALDTLVCLINNRHRVVSRDFLLSEVWKTTSLSDATIPTTIMEIRRALGDSASKPLFIQSVRGRGYRFLPSISQDRITRSPQTQGEIPFVGRDADIQALSDSLRDVVKHKAAQVVLISGEAGIGKTRILSEFISANDGSVQTISVKSPTIEGSPPFWLWTTLLRAALSSDYSSSSLLETSEALRSVFPELSGSSGPSNPKEILVDRFSVITQWIRTIKAIPKGPPVIISLEDIHRADPDSLSLLSCLAEELDREPILLIATHRPPSVSDQRRERISEISSFNRTKKIELSPLSSADISAMLDPLNENRSHLSRVLRDRTSGNAFYVTHLIRNMNAPDNIESPNAILQQLPLSGREIVSRQLSDLPPETKSTLSIASTIGDRFAIQMLADITDTSAEETINNLSAAKLAWIISEDGPSYAFSHSLLRDALYHTLDPLERKKLHLRVARALIDQSQDHLRAAEISHHLASALPLSEPNEARRYAVLAGRGAASRFALTEAAAFFLRALEIEQLNRSSNPEELCKIMQELALAKIYTNDRLGARELLLRAADLARQIDSVDLLSSCALALAPDFLTIEVGIYDRELLDLLRESLRDLPNGDSPLRALLLARLSQAGQWSESPEVTEELAKKALQCARASSDTDALIASLAARAESLHGPAFAEIRMPFINELGELAHERRDTPAILLQHTRSITANLELGNVKEVEIQNEQYRKIAAETMLPQFNWYPKATDAMLAMLRGDLEEGKTLSEEFLTGAGEHTDQNLLQTFACHSVLRSIEQDESGTSIALVEAYSAQQKSMYVWSAALPWLYWDDGQLDRAASLVEEFEISHIPLMAREPGGGVGLGLLSEVSAALNYEKHVDALYEIVLPIADKCSTVGYGVAYLGSFYRYAGLLTKAKGKNADAIKLIGSAYKKERSLNAPSWQAYAVADIVEIGGRPDIPEDEISSLHDTLLKKSLRRATRRLREIGLDAF
ncbi:MAG: AAA family ATPase [Myxococcota bacterium]